MPHWRRLSYQVGVNFNGSETLTVLSTDSSASTDTDTVNITVNPVNYAPTVAHAIADQGATKGTLFTFPLPANTFNDVDGDALVYGATLSSGAALPAGSILMLRRRLSRARRGIAMLAPSR